MLPLANNAINKILSCYSIHFLVGFIPLITDRSWKCIMRFVDKKATDGKTGVAYAKNNILLLEGRVSERCFEALLTVAYLPAWQKPGRECHIS